MGADDIVASSLVHASIASHSEAVANVVPSILLLMHVLHRPHRRAAFLLGETRARDVRVMNDDKRYRTGKCLHELCVARFPLAA